VPIFVVASFFICVQRKILQNSEKTKKFDSYECLLEKSGKNLGQRKNLGDLLVL
jgi:hypothetical protein